MRVFRLAHGLPMPDEPAISRLRDTLHEGDPLTDALVAEAGFSPSLVRRALDEGIGAVPATPALRALFAEIEGRPAWVDDAKLELACATSARVGLDGARVLSCVSLTGGYRSSAANKPLAFTGALEAMASRRLAETSKFVVDVYESGTLDRASEGFAAAVRVRVMHAMVRAKIAADPRWRADDWGLPINQADMLSTNLLFSAVYVFGLRLLGHFITNDEADAFVHLWRYVGHLMGIRDELLPADFREACVLVHIAGTCQPSGDEDGRRLTASLLAVPPRPGLSRPVVALDRAWRVGFSRLALGTEAADQLGLPRVPRAIVVPHLMTNLAIEALRLVVPSTTPLLRRVRTGFVRRHVDDNLGGRAPEYVPHAVRA